MKVSVRLLPLSGKVVEEDVEIPLSERSNINEVTNAVRAVIGKKMPMAGYQAFVNNLSFKEEYKKLATFGSDDVLTIMELPLSVVMP